MITIEKKKFDKKAYDLEFNKRNYKRFYLKFNLEKDKNIIEILNSKDNVNAYIRDLILNDQKK